MNTTSATITACHKAIVCMICALLCLSGCGGGSVAGSDPGSNTNGTNVAQPTTNIVIPYGNTVYNTATGDLNGDGLDDVVVSGWNHDSTTAYIWVLIQNPDGTLSDKTSLLPTHIITGSQRVFIADFDNDGRNDIFAPGFLDGSSMLPTTSTMFWNDGAAFSRQVFNEQVMAHGACLDDINGDGKMDILAAGNNGAGVLYVNRGNRLFTADTSTLNNTWFATCGVIHQANGDINILMGNNAGLPGYRSVIAVYNNRLQFQNYIGVRTNPNEDLINSAVFDADGDGHLDFVLAFSNLYPALPSRRVLLNTGSNAYADGQPLDTLGSDYFTTITSVNGSAAVFLPASGGDARIYGVNSGTMVAYKPSSFSDMAGADLVLTTAVYKNASTGKIYMLQLLNDGHSSAFKTREM